MSLPEDVENNNLEIRNKNQEEIKTRDCIQRETWGFRSMPELTITSLYLKVDSASEVQLFHPNDDECFPNYQQIKNGRVRGRAKDTVARWQKVLPKIPDVVRLPGHLCFDLVTGEEVRCGS
jgi:hypothetical protein